MKFGLGDKILDLGEGPDGQIQPLMPVQSSMVEDQKPIRHFVVLVTRCKDGTIWNIENHAASARADGTGQKPLLPSVIGNDHVARKLDTDPFGHAEEPETNRFFRDSKFAGIEFRQDIADVKNDGGSAEA